MDSFIQELRQRVVVGVVGGSDLPKQKEQLGGNCLERYDYNFAENGLVAYKSGLLIGSQTIRDYLGEDNLKEFINFTLHYIADLDIPIKRFNQKLHFCFFLHLLVELSSSIEQEC